jgi:hypothetical protein
MLRIKDNNSLIGHRTRNTKEQCLQLIIEENKSKGEIVCDEIVQELFRSHRKFEQFQGGLTYTSEERGSL